MTNSNFTNPEDRLQNITEQLDLLQKHLVSQLYQEIEQLQIRKSHLLAEIQQLESKHHDLIQQLAPNLAQQISQLVTEQVLQQGGNQPTGYTNGDWSSYNENAYRLVGSIDQTIRQTFNSLQQDLSTYQNSLSKQLGQMYNLEQQGEVILETLVSRIREELQQKNIPLTPSPSPSIHSQPTILQPSVPLTPNIAEPLIPTSFDFDEAEIPSVPTPPPTPTPPPNKAKNAQIGFLLVLFSSLALSVQNVVIKIVLKKNFILGLWETGGFITPTFGNSLLILFLRMLVVVPLMFLIAGYLYPNTWSDLKKSIEKQDWTLLGLVSACGFFLFISSAFIYLALGSLSAGVALTLFFIFPIVTLICSWLFFKEIPSPVKIGAGVAVTLGVLLINAKTGGATRISTEGIIYAIASGVTFAFHVLLIQFCTKRLHPIPFSLVNFISIFVFAFLSLLLPWSGKLAVNVQPDMWNSIMVSGLVLGVLTLLSYLANNIGISYIGAATSSIVGSTGPMLTSLVAFLLISEALTPIQIAGMVVVTVGVLAINLEKLFVTKKATGLTNIR